VVKRESVILLISDPVWLLSLSRIFWIIALPNI